MASQNLSPIFISLSALGFYLLWVVMGLNGALQAMFETITNGVFPSGRALKMTYTGIETIDFLLLILVVFFDGLSNAIDKVPYMMLLDLVCTLHVINMMTLVESRRVERIRWLRFPALWHYMWNCAGVAVFLPIYSLFYVKQGPRSTSRLLDAEAQATPYTALFSLLLPLPLMLPGLLGASPFRIQDGVVLFFLTPPLFVLFQTLVSSIIKRSEYRGSAEPVRFAYWIVGGASAAVHLGIGVYTVFSPEPTVSLSRIYVPHNSLVRGGHSNIITEGALLFIQYDYVIINVVVAILGTYILRSEPTFLAKSPDGAVRTGGSVLALLSTIVTLGPGAGLAFALYCKERSLSLAQSRSKLLPTIGTDEIEVDEGGSTGVTRQEWEENQLPESTGRLFHFGDFHVFG